MKNVLIITFLTLICSASSLRAQDTSSIRAKFGPVEKEFYVTLPEKPILKGKTTGKQLESFIKSHTKSADFHYALTKENFPNATDKLVAGTTYIIRMIPLLGATGDDCLAYINTTHGLFIGTQAFAVIEEFASDQIPTGVYFISFDKKENLWRDKDLPTMTRVPGITRMHDGKWDFGLGVYESQNLGVGTGSYLICFYEVPSVKL